MLCLQGISKMSFYMSIQFNEQQMTEFKRLVARYPEGKQKSALLPVLHLAQENFDGWLSTPVMDYVASLLSIEPIEVYEVASFYSMYNLKPVGKFVFEVCRTGPCMLVGSDQIIEHIKNRLGISKVGEIIDMGVELGIVQKSGSWFSYDTVKLGQGRDAVKTLFTDNPEMANEIEAKIRAKIAENLAS